METLASNETTAKSLLDNLMDCLAALDQAGARLAAAHVDVAIHAYRDFLEEDQQSSEME